MFRGEPSKRKTLGERLIFITNTLINFPDIANLTDCEGVRDTLGGESGVHTIYLTDDEGIVHAVSVACIMEPDATYTVSATTCSNSI